MRRTFGNPRATRAAFVVVTAVASGAALASCIEDAVLIADGGGGSGASGGAVTTSAMGGAGATNGGGGGGAPGAGGGGAPLDCDHCPGVDTTCQTRVCDPCDVDNADAGTPCTEGGGVKCNGLGDCVECLTAADCPEVGDLCIGFQCGTANGANGDPCANNAECFSGNCSPDGVCCDTPCNGLCESCLAAKTCAGTDGTCAPIPPGNDPDNECPTGACFLGPSCQEGKVVFVSSAQYTGNLGGLTGADMKCQTLATAACLPGNYLAWLSDSTGSPNTRFTQSNIPYRLVNGTLIAANYGDLTDGSIANPVNLTELNGVPLDSPVTCSMQKMSYSATDANGNAVHPMERCSDWSTTSGQASWGYNLVTNGNWTQACFGTGGNTCGAVATLYCFQQ
jgi:hypothetical protein